MPLDAHIVDPETAQIDPELSAEIVAEAHHSLFVRPELKDGRFPLFVRLGDYHADAEFSTGELEALIAEIECIGLLVGPDHAAARFLDRFHSMCCLAFLRGKRVALLAA